MILKEVVELLKAEVHSGADKLSREVKSGYASDLLSEVMAGAKVGQLWFTVQTHPNVAAVALLTDLGAVIITGGHKPEPDTVTKADAEGMVMLSTGFSTFEAINILSQAGL